VLTPAFYGLIFYFGLLACLVRRPAPAEEESEGPARVGRAARQPREAFREGPLPAGGLR
jgi:hypothetical protein